MSKIQIMDEILANKIAAGEVVERCMSVVKELVENSIDAGSEEIKIELKEAGTQLIKVTDNGSGMDRNDALLSFNRHATSKIKEEYDLYHINTLGFRGEALASIASVSDIVLKTSTGKVGTMIHIKGGKVLEVENCMSINGTVIEIKELFYNTPARLKHLKSLYTELASITEYVNKIALSYPNIKFALINNNNVLLKTDGKNNLLKTISDIYGIEVVKQMIEIRGENEDYNISGYISKPLINRSNRNHMITLVNNRVVRNSELNKAINDSYHSYKPDDRYPIVVIKIEVDPTLIDVNIHPTKMDIKFSKIDELLTLITDTIKGVIKKQILVVNPLEQLREIIKPVEQTQENIKPVHEPIYQKPITEKMTFFMEEETVYEQLPKIEAVGLVHGTYIIGQNEKGMYMIDQHAAKERINYELYKNKLGNPTNKMTNLLVPITLEFTNNEYIILKENMDLLITMGFDTTEFGINSIIIKTHPLWLPKGFELESIKHIIEIIIAKEKSFSIEKFNEKIATTLACKMSIKANTNISIEEMNQLLTDLKKCENPYNCPHGRPTIIHYSNYDLEKLFKRSGFENLK